MYILCVCVYKYTYIMYVCVSIYVFTRYFFVYSLLLAISLFASRNDKTKQRVLVSCRLHHLFRQKSREKSYWRGKNTTS